MRNNMLNAFKGFTHLLKHCCLVGPVIVTPFRCQVGLRGVIKAPKIPQSVHDGNEFKFILSDLFFTLKYEIKHTALCLILF